MKIGVFYEHSVARPFHEGREQQLFNEVIEQVELADRLGFHYVWQVEHHFLEEYSHSSAPETLLAAYSQRTRDIRLGHGVVQTPPGYNHPAKVAARVATLDLISNGRVEFGTGESSSEAELGGFGVAREHKRAAWREGTEVALRLLMEEPFTGFEGEFVRMPPRNLVPKPVQRPHPPVWLACSQRESIGLAARNGMGAMTQAFLSPAEAQRWVGEYHHLIENECVPIGGAVNPQIAIGSALACFDTEEEADRLVRGCNFFTFALAWHYVHGSHRPGLTSITEMFEERADDYARAREELRSRPPGPDEIRGVIGTPEQCREELRKYEASGVDQVFLFSQGGDNRHEDICESYERLATEVLPEFIDRDLAQEPARRRRWEEINEKAFARKEALGDRPPPHDPSYTVDAPLVGNEGAAPGPQIF